MTLFLMFVRWITTGSSGCASSGTVTDESALTVVLRLKSKTIVGSKWRENLSAKPTSKKPPTPSHGPTDLALKIAASACTPRRT